MNYRIAFVSPLGGSGQTTLVAALGHVWAAQGRPTLVWELTRRNDLGLHCGLVQPPLQGWLQRHASGEWWGEAALENSAGLRLVPSGPGEMGSSGDGGMVQTDPANPGWLEEQLSELVPEPDARLLLDLPAWPDPLCMQALRSADLLVVTLEPSVRSVLARDAVLAMRAMLRRQARLALVVSRFNPRRAAQAQAMAQLRSQWGQALSPYALHDDESIPLALCQGASVVHATPDAQAAHDIQGLAAWLLSQA